MRLCATVVTVLAFAVSAAGYLRPLAPLMSGAFASLPLLLIWVLAATAARTTTVLPGDVNLHVMDQSEDAPTA